MINKIKNILRSKVGLFITLAIISILTVAALDFLDEEFSVHDILVEFHGLVFDLIIFGIVLTIYESYRSKKELDSKKLNQRQNLIDRYKEEINDYRFWKSEESFFRIRGLVKRLVNLGEADIDLSYCHLETDKSLSSYKNMAGWIFSASHLSGCWFICANIQNAEFFLTNLDEAKFISSNLTKCNFSQSDLFMAEFEECDLTDINLEGAIVHRNDWFEMLIKNKNTGVESLQKKYFINDEYFKHRKDIAHRIELRS